MVAERGNAPAPAAPSKAESFQIRKARLRASFLSPLPGRLADARRAVAELHPGEIDHARLDALYILFHTLKGSGATFGFRQISDTAKSAEQAVRHAMDSGGRVEATLPPDLERLMDDLDALALAADVQVDPDVAPEFELPEPESEPTAGQAPGARPGQPADRSQRMVYLCDDNPDLAAQLAGQLGCFGYRVRAFTNLADLPAAVDTERPAAMILDIVFTENENAGPKMLAEIRAGEEEAIPCIFISCRDDFRRAPSSGACRRQRLMH